MKILAFICLNVEILNCVEDFEGNSVERSGMTTGINEF
jgi:hypothetical protein